MPLHSSLGNKSETPSQKKKRKSMCAELETVNSTWKRQVRLLRGGDFQLKLERSIDMHWVDERGKGEHPGDGN